MGRSVDYLSHAIHVAYIDVDFPDKLENEEGEMVDPTDFDYECHWDWFTDVMYESIPKGIKSLENIHKEHRFDGRETHIIFENKHCEIGLSEYFGIASISIRVNERYYPDHPQLAKTWIKKVWPRIIRNLKESFPNQLLIKQGTFSNGEGVYAKMK